MQNCLTVKQAISAAKLKDDPNSFLGLLEIYLLLEHVLKKAKTFLQMNFDYQITQKDFDNFMELCSLRLQGMPVAKITGNKYFWKDKFITNQYTLDPRPDSETLIEHVIRVFPDLTGTYKILDLGTGTGCLGLSLLREYINSKALLVDNSDNALSVAKNNAQNLGLCDRAEFIESDWVSNVGEKFDIIVANPPYIPNLDIDKLDIQVNFDPNGALFGGEDGLSCYRSIASTVRKVCNSTTHLFFEIGQGQESDLAKIMEQFGFHQHSFSKDLNGIIRVCAFNLS